MDFIGTLVLDLYSLVILFIIYIQVKKQHIGMSKQSQIYMAFVKMTAWLIVMDIMSRIDCNRGTIYLLINHFANFMLFALNLVLPSLWILYAYAQIEQLEGRMKRLIYLLGILNCLNIVAVSISQCYGWFYYYDSQNNYQRGPWYNIPVIITFTLITIAYVVIIQNRKKLDTKQGITLFFFAVLPCISIILQTLFMGLSLMLNCLVISLLLAFLNIQNYNLYTDYLTGVFNRKKFDLYLNEKIKTAAEGKNFSAIMLDMNDFKKINDTFGHMTGDHALRLSIRLLNSCLRDNDFIARVGGDEFCIILDIDEENGLKEIVERINKCFINYNAVSSQQYKLFFSMGYAVYDHNKYEKADTFLKQLDELMYQNKQMNKLKSKKEKGKK